MGKRKRPPPMKALPHWELIYKEGVVDIYYTKITISGPFEDAAMALANNIMNERKDPTRNAVEGALPGAYTQFRGCLKIVDDNGKITLHLRDTFPTIDQELWQKLKKQVEKICNDLAVFM